MSNDPVAAARDAMRPILVRFADTLPQDVPVVIPLTDLAAAAAEAIGGVELLKLPDYRPDDEPNRYPLGVDGITSDPAFVEIITAAGNLRLRIFTVHTDPDTDVATDVEAAVIYGSPALLRPVLLALLAAGTHADVKAAAGPDREGAVTARIELS